MFFGLSSARFVRLGVRRYVRTAGYREIQSTGFPAPLDHALLYDEIEYDCTIRFTSVLSSPKHERVNAHETKCKARFGAEKNRARGCQLVTIKSEKTVLYVCRVGGKDRVKNSLGKR